MGKGEAQRPETGPPDAQPHAGDGAAPQRIDRRAAHLRRSPEETVSARKPSRSLWNPGPRSEWYPELQKLDIRVDPSVTPEQIRQAVQDGWDSWPCPPVTMRDLLTMLD
jgi:hypothetical protein